ncbi:MAG: hypothetical protein O3B87_01940 [bacterium]|nr:hypothetical protein [bacterium]
MILNRHPQNPIIAPNPSNAWESFATFNGTIIKKNDTYHLFYRAMGEEIMVHNHRLRMSTIGKATSKDGITFNSRELFIKPEHAWEQYGCEDPRVVRLDETYYIFYTALGNYPPNERGIKVGVALSSDLKSISEKHLVTPFNAKAMTLFSEKINGLYTAILTVNTDKPPSHIAIAQFEHISTLWDVDYWEDWYRNFEDHIIHLRRVNSDQVELGAPPIKSAHGWILIYSYIKHYLSKDIPKEFRIESILLDVNNPKKIIGRIEKPLLIPEAEYELHGQIENIVFPEGAIIENDNLNVYYGAADSYCALASVDVSTFISHFEINTPATLKCEKFRNNPLLEPLEKHPWESKAVFNPAAVEINNVVYIIYRTTSSDNQSHLGLAISYDGISIDERLEDPIYPLRTVFEKSEISGHPAGAEDPRITKMGDTLYMLYTAYDGKMPRLAMTSISTQHFLSRKWDMWTEPKIISAPDVPDKDGALFPEKIQGKYVFLHRVEPNIVIDTVDDLEFKSKPYLDKVGIIAPRNGSWDSVKIGINDPPIKTADGWLIIYHGISQIDHHYRIGTLLLDLVDVTQVLARTPYPILEPEATYEREGVVDNVVFPCGHVVKGDELYFYYGAADKVLCGAKVRISDLLSYLRASHEKRYLQ